MEKLQYNDKSQMRIGIVTLPIRTNYGGILQAYALQTVLERMGHKVVVFAKPHTFRLSFLRKCKAYPKRFFNKYFLRKNTIILWEQYMNNRTAVSMKFTGPFIDRNVHLKMVNDFQDLKESDYDAIIVGSDQIWRPLYYPHIEDAYLKFAEGWNIKRFSYAPSFGVDEWEYSKDQTEECKRLLKLFDAVSTREESGTMLCRNYLGREAEWVLDPTMLLEVQDYIRLFEMSNIPPSKGELFCYILDPSEEKEVVINDISKINNITPFAVNSQVDDLNADFANCVQPPVESWLRGFFDAKFVVTDSFHACVFSILFKKQFVVVGNQERGLSRIKSLLKIFGLEDRLVNQNFVASKLNMIDYDTVDKKLHEWRERSMSFLNEIKK